MSNTASNRFEGETSLFPSPKAAMEALYVDHFGPLQETSEKYRYILVIVDAYTRFTWLFPVRGTGSTEAIEKLQTILDIFGKPSELVSDRGTAFTSKEFDSFMGKHRIKHRKVAVAAPWANGLVERVNRFLKSTLTKLLDTPNDWKEHLGTAQYIINNTYHSVVKSSPSQLMLGYDQRSHTDFPLAQFTRELTGIDEDLENNRIVRRSVAEEANELVRNYNKKYRDYKHKKPSLYKEGDYVMIRDIRVKTGENAKLKPKYKGPYMVAKILGNNRYVIKDIPGFNQTARPLYTVLSSDKLKPWIQVNPSI